MFTFFIISLGHPLQLSVSIPDSKISNTINPLIKTQVSAKRFKDPLDFPPKIYINI